MNGGICLTPKIIEKLVFRFVTSVGQETNELHHEQSNLRYLHSEAQIHH